MNALPPIGSVCPYAGQVDRFNGSLNERWNGMKCKTNKPIAGQKASSPLNHLEQSGWMLCDGRALSAASYPELYAVIGTLYGETGSGTSQDFCIPDYRGLFLRGNDAGACLDPDADTRVGPDGKGTMNVVGSLQCDAMRSDYSQLYDSYQPATSASNGTTTKTRTSIPSAQNTYRTPSETRPKNIAVNYIIRFR